MRGRRAARAPLVRVRIARARARLYSHPERVSVAAESVILKKARGGCERPARLACDARAR